MTLNLLIAYFKKLIAEKYTGQIRVNLHKGDLAEKVERKDSHHLKGDGE